jgi:hypothetical protein
MQRGRLERLRVSPQKKEIVNVRCEDRLCVIVQKGVHTPSCWFFRDGDEERRGQEMIEGLTGSKTSGDEANTSLKI